jgi:hypothetical protein
MVIPAKAKSIIPTESTLWRLAGGSKTQPTPQIYTKGMARIENLCEAMLPMANA